MKILILISFCLLFLIITNAQSNSKTNALHKKNAVPKVISNMPSPVGTWAFTQINKSIDSLTIKSDSTYRFAEYQQGVSVPETFSGKWKIKGMNVFLYAGADSAPYGQLRAALSADGIRIEKFRVIRYFGELQKNAIQIELTEKK